MASVLIVGGGGREHALAHVLSRSASKPQIFIAPGNAGTDSLGENVALSGNEAIVRFAEERAIDLVVIGPEAPLSEGLADAIRDKGILALGPGAAAARLEASKSFAKDIMAAAHVPTARWKACASTEEAKRFAAELDYKVAVKADGLAGGKGVIVADDRASAESAIDALMHGRNLLVVEEKLEGEELSVIGLVDGQRIALLLPSQDHKRVGEGDTGPNTGGMGAYAPAPRGTEALLQVALERCMKPVIEELKKRGAPFCGVLYAGLMLTADGPKVLEYNVRFGDPEAQVILPLLDEDAFELFCSVARGALPERPLRMKSGAALTVVLAAENYPEKPRTGDAISGLDRVSGDDVVVFHAGTVRDGHVVKTAGGRVLTVTGIGADLPAASARAYDAASRITWPGMHYRRDIGARGR